MTMLKRAVKTCCAVVDDVSAEYETDEMSDHYVTPKIFLISSALL